MGVGATQRDVALFINYEAGFFPFFKLVNHFGR